jgi:alpha-amylase
MKFSDTALVALVSLAGSVSALSPAGWRSQSIYQVLTDRFARTDGSTTATCNTEDQIYCGGSWQGIINKLDYVRTFPFHRSSERC